jgi:hypothetical protein
MPEHLSFEEVADALNCSRGKVRRLVLEDKTLIATRVTPYGAILTECGPDDLHPYDLDVNCSVDDDGKIVAVLFELIGGATVQKDTIHAGYLRIERASLNRFIQDHQSASENALGRRATFAADDDGARGKRWTSLKLKELADFRSRHSAKETAEHFKISTSRVRQLLPSDRPRSTGFRGFPPAKK